MQIETQIIKYDKDTKFLTNEIFRKVLKRVSRTKNPEDIRKSMFF